MLKKLGLLSCFLFSPLVMAETVVDIYGVHGEQAQTIVKKYSHRIAKIEDKLLTFNINHRLNEQQLIKLIKQRQSLIETIKNEYRFAFVDFQTINYPDDKNAYTTIEVIKSNLSPRLNFLDAMKNQTVPGPMRNDLISKMMEYSMLSMELFVKNELNSKEISCPVYHCTMGFSHPKLRPYLDVFNEGVKKEKPLILSTLNNEVNPERKAAACFLVGHFDDPKEIISTLLPHVNDPSPAVRNNAIRVIGVTMLKAKINHIDVEPFLTLLQSPYTTDRNKSLMVLLQAASSSADKKLILQKGGKRLLRILALKQPNNHEYAYLILKKISGKHYSESDLSAWENWLAGKHGVNKIA